MLRRNNHSPKSVTIVQIVCVPCVARMSRCTRPCHMAVAIAALLVPQNFFGNTMRTVRYLFLILACGLSASAAQAQMQLSGTFVADQSCPASQSIKTNRNPGNIRLRPGKSYELLASNKDQPTHYQIEVSGAKPAQRWVPVECGHVSGNRPAVPVKPVPAEPAPAGPEESANRPEYVLAVTWQPAFCETKPGKTECRSMTDARFDASHFTLHGLWPQPESNAYCNVSYADQNNDRGNWDNLPPVRLDSATRRELDQVMPGTASDLDRHEWIKHGTCYGKNQQGYYADALRLMRSLNQSAVQQLFAGSIGRQLTSARIRSAFDQSFGQGAGQRVHIDCAQGPTAGQTMITGLSIELTGPVTDGKNLGDLILAANPARNPGCRAGVVDRAGIQ